ncbi:hypothetical protein SPI_02600 [Niveomyces insectorum RCEF 264]|uniref:Uncharacterized protein n=1 Tax=Niveomyces insectorum RCEF 264 TaxID=1081102 RepID=A0A167Y466_9HYPO|nr:hypothetical protein SPI_02600 [Niveomyces insectorum RCEF 264]
MSATEEEWIDFVSQERGNMSAQLPPRGNHYRHREQPGRRRSSNADILEKYGLPSTGSYSDMQSLEDGLTIEDILGHADTSCCGPLHETIVALRKKASHTAKKASKSVKKAAARWTRKMTPSAVNNKRQRMTTQPPTTKSDSLSSSESQLSMQGWTSSSPSTRGILKESPVLQSSAFQVEDRRDVIPPGQWLRQRNAF